MFLFDLGASIYNLVLFKMYGRNINLYEKGCCGSSFKLTITIYMNCLLDCCDESGGWLARPKRARKPYPEVGQRWVRAVLLVLVALTPYLAFLLCCLGSFFLHCLRSCVDGSAQFVANVSSVSELMEKSLRETLRLSL